MTSQIWYPYPNLELDRRGNADRDFNLTFVAGTQCSVFLRFFNLCNLWFLFCISCLFGSGLSMLGLPVLHHPFSFFYSMVLE
ncbi:hypothetical protein KsCSTR_24290 [Candidatus Kuenenia stuttgartiensis]|uniref:Uncharacterized protein n=1 Tax=Kuenenia stuttgartiensis TaxID=174633 RepID=Q1Q3X2_KUEST|nr:hypothetical protein KsCSTR_24290 [Candidatus Kuenenia stuttgartiensis]CAJ74704.1 unknown protein [Candidatus Kuenenia stuttgartiensis]